MSGRRPFEGPSGQEGGAGAGRGPDRGPGDGPAPGPGEGRPAAGGGAPEAGASRAPPPAHLYRDPNALARHYSRFRVAHRLLLTGHSHQAWPDRAYEGQKRAWWDAAERVDEKWGRALEKADRVRDGFARLLGEAARRDAHIALGQNTHELLVRFLSAIPLRERPRLVTTDAEFHSIRRQLDRLAEEGIEVVKVPSRPADSAGVRVAEAVDDRTAAALMSSVFYADARIAGGLAEAARACRRRGAAFLVDAYHSLNAVPFSLEGLEDAWVVGGGYKYCQLGEGNCFLRFPSSPPWRPVVTGWFSEFSSLEAEARGEVAYGEGADRFAGSTYDPTSHYRAAEVFAFFEERDLTPEYLREVSLHQVGLLARRFDALGLDPAVVDRRRDLGPGAIGGFLALRSSRAGELSRALGERGVRTDHRGDLLRLGPAPYLCDRQLEDAVEALGEAARAL